jgi:signal transduction histidine kinase
MSRPRIGHRFLARGESLVATLGIHGSLILLCVVGATWWWTARTHRASLQEQQRALVHEANGLVARALEPLLASGDLSAARCLVADLARRTHADECVLEAPNGGVLAASDPSRITIAAAPASWPAAEALPEDTALEDDTLQASTPVSFAPDAWGQLRLRAAVAYPAWTAWEIQLGGAAAAVAGLGAFLGVYHRVRTRMRALGAVGDALRCIADGERSRETLEVSETFGPVAAAWNEVLRDLDAFRAALTLERSAHADPDGSRRRDESLADACDAMWHGLILLDDHLRIRYINGAAAAFLSSTREALTGADARASIPFEQVVGVLGSLHERGPRARAAIEVEPADGRTILRFTVRPLRKSDTMTATILIEDVTQQRLADRSRNSFVAQATHELRTPLTNIRVYVEDLLEREHADAAERARSLNVVNSEVRRLERIVGDMLSVSELEAGSMSLASDDVRLDALFASLEEDFRLPAQEKGVSLAFRLPPKLPVIKGDRDKLTMALANVVGNALKYTPSGGEVAVSVSAVDAQVSVEVTDTGIGISDADAAMVFEKFYRARDKRLSGIPGSGLGLALARQVARMHGGDITLHSVLDKGSTFTFTLPAAAPVSLAA